MAWIFLWPRDDVNTTTTPTVGVVQVPIISTEPLVQGRVYINLIGVLNVPDARGVYNEIFVLSLAQISIAGITSLGRV
jgi:hypothetical protein